MRRCLAVLALGLALTGCSSSTPRQPDDPADAAGSLELGQPRAVHRATLLDDGRVLITGGCTETGCGGFDAGRRSEIYDAGHLEPGPVMATPRASGTATLLDDGRVLLTGGYPGEGEAPTPAAEVFDPTTNEFSAVGDLRRARADHTATLLPDGRVLVAGGFDAAGRALADSEIFDPETGEFTQGPDLSAPRAAHVAVPIDGAVVVVGGTTDSQGLATTDVFRSGRWRPGPHLLTPRVKMGAAAVGRSVLFVVGGATDVEGRTRLDSTELVNMRTGQVTAGPRLLDGEYKLDGAIATLPDGRVVVPAGRALEVYDARSASLTPLDVTTYDARSFRTMTPIGEDQVLVVGGYDEAIAPTDQAVLVRIPAF